MSLQSPIIEAYHRKSKCVQPTRIFNRSKINFPHLCCLSVLRQGLIIGSIIRPRSWTKLVLDPLFDLALNDFLRLASQEKLCLVFENCLRLSDSKNHMSKAWRGHSWHVDGQGRPARFFQASNRLDQMDVTGILKARKKPVHWLATILLYLPTQNGKQTSHSHLLHGNGLARASATHQKAVEMLGVQGSQNEEISLESSGNLCMHNLLWSQKATSNQKNL